jgi:hypothetical protein
MAEPIYGGECVDCGSICRLPLIREDWRHILRALAAYEADTNLSGDGAERNRSLIEYAQAIAGQD